MAALIAHTAWKQRLDQAIDAGIIDPPPSVIALDNQCVFGKWLYSETIPTSVKQLSEYQEVRSIHAQFHKLTAEIAMLAVTGDKAKAKAALAEESDYAQLSDKLKSALLSLARVV
ncbi:MAG: CZB domain-containing protein [Cyanobacteria bacterium KgW148]|nr:CZB domain-containing protein [Cyanobacteria bacterium KgW148]